MRFVNKALEPIIISATILLFTALNVWHIITEYMKNPAGKIFVGISHYHEDYFYYLSQVTQGIEGAMGVKNLYTPEYIPETILWWPNIMLGKIAAVTQLPPWTVYDWSLILASASSLFLLYVAARKMFPKDAIVRVGAFLIAVTSTMFYVWEKSPDGASYPAAVTYFYNYTASLNRLGGVFHLILQNILSLGAILSASEIINSIFGKNQSSRRYTKQALILSTLLTSLMFINPLYVAVDVVTIAVVSMGFLIRNFSFRRLWMLLLVALISGIPLIVPLLAILGTFDIPFFQYFRWWETSVLKTTPPIFFRSMGIIVIPVILGIIPFLTRGTPLRILGFIWAMLPIAVYFSDLPMRFQFPAFRLTQPPSYIVLAALAAEGFMIPGMILGKIFNKRLIHLPFIILVTAFIAWQIPMITHEVIGRSKNFALTSWLNHMEPEMYQGLLELKKYPKTGFVISLNNAELMIPVISGHTMYAGHHSLTLDFPGKIAEVIRFFTSQMTYDEAMQFLKSKSISYIVWRKTDGPTSVKTTYPFLKVLYENPVIVIYTP